MNRLWMDSHCHLADTRFTKDLEKLLSEAREVGIGAWVQGGIDPEDWARQSHLKEQVGSGFLTCFGLHPWWVSSASAAQLEEGLKALEIALPQAQAIGELGLDKALKFKDKFNVQLAAFESQATLASKTSKPWVLHVVRAHPEALSVLRRFQPKRGGWVHAFSGSKEVMKQYLDLGLSISVGGAITREGHESLKKAVKFIPAESLLIETDCPDQTPWVAGLAPGSLNQPKYLLNIAEAVGQLRGQSKEAILDQSSDNLRRFFERE